MKDRGLNSQAVLKSKWIRYIHALVKPQPKQESPVIRVNKQVVMPSLKNDLGRIIRTDGIKISPNSFNNKKIELLNSFCVFTINGL
jgi:translation initiation factor 2 alpha subunit (eIF-2alpha)